MSKMKKKKDLKLKIKQPRPSLRGSNDPAVILRFILIFFNRQMMRLLYAHALSLANKDALANTYAMLEMSLCLLIGSCIN